MLQKTNAALKQYADRLIRMEEERVALAADTKAIFDEAKAEGFTPSALRKAIKIHAMDADKRQKHDAEQMDLELYLQQLEGREASQ